MAIIEFPEKFRQGKIKRRYMKGNKARWRISEQGGGVASAPAPPAFSPDDIAGLQLWLKADAIVGLSDGDPISTWEDSSTNNRDATQAGAARPTYKVNIVNSLPVVRFDASTNESLVLPNFLTTLTAAEVFIVFKLVADPPATGLGGMWNLGSDANSAHIPFTDGVIYDDFGTTVRKTTVNPATSLATAFRLYNVSSASGNWTSRLDTTQIHTTATNTVGWTTSPILGASPAGGAFLDGDLAELVLYDSVLSAGDRSDVEDYFDDKYALAF